MANSKAAAVGSGADRKGREAWCVDLLGLWILGTERLRGTYCVIIYEMKEHRVSARDESGSTTGPILVTRGVSFF